MSLADLSAQIRTLTKWLLVVPAVLLVLWLIWLGVKETSTRTFKPRGQDIAFGNLAPPAFTKVFSSLEARNFELATSIPKSPPKADVFQIEASEKFSPEQQKEIVNFFGLSNSKKSEDNGTITWQGSSASLTFDVVKGTFSYRLDFSTSSSLTQKAALDKDQVLKKAKEILTKINLSPKDIDQNNPSIRFFLISGKSREEVSASEANAAEIGFFRRVANTTSSGDFLIRLLVGENSGRILEFDYHYYPLNPLPSPYPVISGEEAYRYLQEGKAFTKEAEKFDFITVKKIRLSYWESNFVQQYLQPIWLFSLKGRKVEDEKEFEAYLPAISPSYLWKEEETQP